MTNEEYIKTLATKELSEHLSALDCTHCGYRVLKWMRKEHKDE